MSAILTLDIDDDGVALVTINRPRHRNAIDKAMSDELEKAFARVGTDPAVRVVVLTGAGDCFTAGGDMDRLDGLVESRGASLGEPPPEGPHLHLDVLTGVEPELRAHFTTPVAIPVPVIAAINGACSGIGLALAAASDMRWMSEDAFIFAGFPRLGLTAEAGLAYTLPRIVGTGAASDILLSGRKVSARECLRMGFANDVMPRGDLMPFVLDYARDMARNVSPRSTRVIKRQIRKGWTQTQADAMQLGYREVLDSLACDDFAEGVAAFVERRPPRFTGD